MFEWLVLQGGVVCKFMEASLADRLLWCEVSTAKLTGATLRAGVPFVLWVELVAVRAGDQWDDITDKGQRVAELFGCLVAIFWSFGQRAKDDT